jgi:serine O-acetyltransferase
MQSSLNSESLLLYVRSQLNNNFPDQDNLDDLKFAINKALNKLEYCLQNTTYKLNWKNNDCYFNHLNADQYTIFIYFLSNIVYLEFNNTNLASKLFYLNKILHSFHCMYDTQLPNVFLVLHGVGIVLGKAKYSDNFVVTQNCTVGSNYTGEQPYIGKSVIMYPGSSIIGNSTIGLNSCISSGSFINNAFINENSLVIGRSPELKILKNKSERLSRFFKNNTVL